MINVWIDASSLGTGVSLKIKGSVIEHACQLRAANDAHAHLPELHALLKGINSALPLQVTVVNLVTDTAYVYDALTGKDRLHFKGAYSDGSTHL